MLGLNKENLKGLIAEDVSDSIGVVVAAFNAFAVSSTPLEEAVNLLNLNNSIQDLKSWHVDFNSTSGVVEGIAGDSYFNEEEE